MKENILVTGAGSGIGREVAIAAADMGKPYLVSRMLRNYILSKMINKNHSLNPLVVEFDFLKAKGSDYQKLGEALYEEYEKLDGIAHIAGILSYFHL